ncbi:hypothetical protein GCM10027563_24170 [Parasphingorhabdus pacifica]
MPEQVRELGPNPAFAVEQVGGADPARLHFDECLAGAGVRYEHVDYLDGRTLLGRHDASDLVLHGRSPLSARTGSEGEAKRSHGGVGAWSTELLDASKTMQPGDASVKGCATGYLAVASGGWLLAKTPARGGKILWRAVGCSLDAV